MAGTRARGCSPDRLRGFQYDTSFKRLWLDARPVHRHAASERPQTFGDVPLTVADQPDRFRLRIKAFRGDGHQSPAQQPDTSRFRPPALGGGSELRLTRILSDGSPYT